MARKTTSAHLLKEFGKGPKPGQTSEQRTEQALSVLGAMLGEGRIKKASVISAPGPFGQSRIATLVMSTVNAPYGTFYNAQDLAALITTPGIERQHDAAVFAFFSEVGVDLQTAFLAEEGIPLRHAISVAQRLSTLAGYDLPLLKLKSTLTEADGPSTPQKTPN